MADVIMNQSIRVLLLSLARSFPGLKISINAVGPIHIVNGEVKELGERTNSTVDLADVKRTDLPAPPAAIEELQAVAAHTLAKKCNKSSRRRKG